MYITIAHPRLGRLVIHLLAPWLRQVYGLRRWQVRCLIDAARNMVIYARSQGIR